ncbi:hypothetical protein MesoLj131b_07960 [Mesorhizobium sp. 131-2-5]|uniref:hypothetical protein n=1 Tax=Mesorhizobium sp. 131-2-5 TaxID=2744519 RepID=UPI0019260D5D|nr:hypothetical protein [Mesorhizobium sp. 131-2-5]BCG98796.1 hypothetical protein MesoLj131b_07960 [Mesorhizobium sp. 131-2-5]
MNATEAAEWLQINEQIFITASGLIEMAEAGRGPMAFADNFGLAFRDVSLAHWARYIKLRASDDALSWDAQTSPLPIDDSEQSNPRLLLVQRSDTDASFLKQQFEAFGFEVIGPLGILPAMAAACFGVDFDAAFIQMDYTNTDLVTGLVATLLTCDIPFVVANLGVADAPRIVRRGGPVLQAPYTIDELAIAFATLSKSLRYSVDLTARIEDLRSYPEPETADEEPPVVQKPVLN